jgi:hypothetical protein
MTVHIRTGRRGAAVALFTLGTLIAACDDAVTAPTPSSGVASILQWQATVGPDSSSQPAPRASFTWRPALAAGFVGPSTPIVAPDTVFAGIPFTVEIRTILPSPCWGGTQVTPTQTGSVLLLEPVDVYNANAICAQVLVFASRSTTATFTTPGVATIRVRGRRVSFVPSEDVQATVERQVVVLRNPRG